MAELGSTTVYGDLTIKRAVNCKGPVYINNKGLLFEAVSGSVTITAGSYLEYDLDVLLAKFGGITNFNVMATLIDVKIRNIDSGSPTFNMYINSEAKISTAINLNRYIRVYNYHTQSLDCYVHITVQPK